MYSLINWVVSPLNLISIVLLGSLCCALFKFSRHVSTFLCGFGALFMAVVVFTPLPQLLVGEMEGLYKKPQIGPGQVDGIVLIGGSQRIGFVGQDGNDELAAQPDELTFIRLANAYPNARLIFAGGGAHLGVTEAEVFQRLYGELKGRDGLIVDSRSTNTYENVANARALADPREGETWVVVAKAVHMPRVAACFRKLRWEVMPYPVGYLVPEGVRDSTLDAVGQMGLLKTGLHELFGMMFYRFKYGVKNQDRILDDDSRAKP